MNTPKNYQYQSRIQLRLRRHEHLWENNNSTSSQRLKSAVQLFQPQIDQSKFNQENNRVNAFEYRGGTA